MSTSPGVALRVLLLQPCVDDVKCSCCLLVRFVGLQTRDRADTRIRTTYFEAFGRETDGYRDVCIKSKLKMLWCYADHCKTLIIQRDWFSDNALILTKPAVPQAITHDD